METYGDEKPQEFRWYHPSRWEQQISLEISWVIMGPLQIAVWSTPLLNEHEQTRTAAIITQKWGYSSTSTEREREGYIYNIHTMYIYICIRDIYQPPINHFNPMSPGFPGFPGPLRGPTLRGDLHRWGDPRVTPHSSREDWIKRWRKLCESWRNWMDMDG